MKKKISNEMVFSAAVLRRKVFDLKLDLIDGEADSKSMEDISSFMLVSRCQSRDRPTFLKFTNMLHLGQKNDYESIIEERNLSGICGYPRCMRSLSAQQ
jgi:hypothetical protein